MPSLPDSWPCSFYVQSLFLSSAAFPSFLHSGQSLSPSCSVLPANGETLIRFCAHLADTVHHSTIKVYLSAIWSLHIEEGLAGPLVGCLQLQCVLQGIKHYQGSHQPKGQPITSDLLQIICHSLDPSNHNHKMLQAACCLGFFSFLRAGEFTVNSPFNPDIHLTINDIQADSLLNSRSFRIFIECSKTDPFCQGYYIYIGTSLSDLCPLCALIQ